MPRPSPLLPVLAAALLPLPAPRALPAQAVAAPAPSVVPPVDTLVLQAHAAFLADDALGGRANDTPGGRAAVAYLEAQFRRLGLEPAGEGGGYLQAVPLFRVEVAPARTRLVVRRAGAGRADTIPSSGFHHLGGDTAAFRAFEGRLLHAGSVGAAIAALGSRASLAGTVVVATSGGGVLDSLAALLEARGAEALLLVVPDAGRYGGLRNARGPVRYAVRGERIAGPVGGRLPVLLLAPNVAGRLGVPATPSPSATPAESGRVSLEVAATIRPAVAWNVLARLPGADPARREEHVALVAHHDHIGTAPSVEGDSVYNGFIDNAVGVAAVLAAAEAMRARPPARSTLFFLAGTEEQGSLGSAYWVRRPTVGRLVGAINLDAGAPLAPPSSWLVEGGEGSPLGRAAIATARRAGWTAEPLPLQPSSDHWSFHAAGIPAVFLVPGETWEGVTAPQAEALIARWWRAHRPDDEWSPEFPLAGLRRYAEYAMRIVYELP